MVNPHRTKGKTETLYFFVLNAFSKFLTYFLLLAFANLFTVIDYGQAAFALSAFTFVSVLSQIGLPYVIIPYLVKKDKSAKSIFWFLAAFTSAFTIIGLIICTRFTWITPLVLSLPFLLLYGIGRAQLRAEHKYHLIQITDTLSMLLTFLFVILFASGGKFGIILAYASSNVLMSLGVIAITSKSIKNLAIPFEFDRAKVKIYLGKAALAFIVFISIDILNKADSLILGAMSTYANVANYNIAYSIATVIYAVPFAVAMFLLTRTAEIENEQVSKNVFARCMRISFSFSLLIAILLNSAIFILTNWFFNKYTGIEIFVAILSCAAIFFSVYFLFFNYLTGKLSPEKAFGPMLIATITNIVLDLVLIGSLGALGVCIATAIAQGTALIIFGIKVLGWKRLVTIYLSSLWVFAAFLLHEIGVILVIPAVAYLWITKSITRADLRIIRDTVTHSLGRR